MLNKILFLMSTFYLSSFLGINGQNWYSADVADRKFEGYRPNYFPDEEHKYLPDMPSGNVTELKESETLAVANNGSGNPHKQNEDDIKQKTKDETKESRNIKLRRKEQHQTKITDLKKNIKYSSKNDHNKTENKMRLRSKKKQRCPVRSNKKYFDFKNKARFLEVFQVVEFEHVICTSSSGLEGKCLHEYECKSSGGSLMGDCADGYGTCCVMQMSCGQQTDAQLSWFTNPGYPSPSSERLSCAVTLDKASVDITQIRLDFMTFELQPPKYGTCEQDQFVISGQNINSFVPILCGVNNGQHIYIEIGDVAGPIYLSLQTVTSDTRLFAVKITQLSAYDPLSAPSGCLQYFIDPRGYLESFNYQDTSTIAIARNPSYLNNLNYAMCIKRVPQMCSISYTSGGDMQIMNYDTDGLPIIPPGQAGVEIFNCPSDWLLTAAARLCGERLNDGSILQDFSLDAPVIDVAAGPIVVWFKSDGAVTGRGFRLEYQQNSCISPT